jgi:hypothetical protein
MGATVFLRNNSFARRLALTIVGVWLSAMVLPCLAAGSACPTPLDGKACHGAVVQDCDAVTLDCATPPSKSPNSVNIDAPLFAPIVLTILTAAGLHDPVPPRQWHRSSLRVPAAAYHYLRFVRLLI